MYEEPIKKRRDLMGKEIRMAYDDDGDILDISIGDPVVNINSYFPDAFVPFYPFSMQ